MKFVKRLPFALCLLLAAAAAGAQSMRVVFLEGKAEAGRDSKWADLAVGSAVHPGATVRLPTGSLLRLSGMGSDLTLARPGTYALRDVVAARYSAFVGGAAGVAGDAARVIAFGASKQQGVVLGAQSADDDKPSSKPGADDPVEAGREDIRSKQYASAVEKLNKALGSAKGDQAAEIHYCLAYAYTLDGRLPEAWKQADGLAPGSAPWAADLTLLRARLLLETGAYAEAISMLVDASKGFSQDAQRGALCSYLTGLGYRGAGQSKEAAQALTQASTLSPASDLGRSARFLAMVP